MASKNIDKEQEKLKEEIKKIIGEKELDRINNIVNLSYQFDESPKYRIDFKIIR